MQKGDLHPYLIYTESLSLEERQSLLDFLDKISFIGPSVLASTIGPNPQYIAYCYQTASAFASLPFPVQFRWKDLTGYDLAGFG